MRTIDTETIKEVVKLHKMYLECEYGGRRADLSHADLKGADFRSADLRRSDFSYADLRDVNFSCADLKDSDLSHTDLMDANLSDANLAGVKLDYSSLPLVKETLEADMDDDLVKQLLYFTLSIIKNSKNVSQELKDQFLTEENIAVAKEYSGASNFKTL